MSLTNTNYLNSNSVKRRFELFTFNNLDYVLIFICLSAINLQSVFKGNSAAVYIAFGMALYITGFKNALSETFKHWHFLIFPLFCMLSFFWSNYPLLTVRYGFQLFITFLISLLISSRLKRENLYNLFVYLFVFTFIISVLFGNNNPGVPWTGVFLSKNMFADALAILFMLCFTYVFFKSKNILENIFIFMIAIAVIPVFFKADSAGALVSVVPALILGMFLSLTLGMNLTLKMIIVLLAISLVVFLGTLIAVNFEYVQRLFLGVLGKDATLTGRTELWDFALEKIKLKPMLGVGYQAFWVRGNTDAENIWSMFYIKGRAGFNFHNTYISNAVEIGLIGVILQVIIVYYGFFKNLAVVFVRKDKVALFFTMYLFYTIIRSFYEVTFFTQFSIPTIMALFAILDSYKTKIKQNANIRIAF